MQPLLSFLPVLAIRFFRSRRDLLLENLALRQQLAVLKLRHPQPRFAASDKWFWVMSCRLWPGWKQALILVQPETVVGWHRAGFKLYWKWLSRHRTRAVRRCVSKELRELIFRMVAENLTWGAPRIHGELRMLGFDISERNIGANGVALDAEGSEECRASEALGGFLGQPPRSDCSDGFLYRADADLRCPALLLRHCTRQTADSPLQRHQASK